MTNEAVIIELGPNAGKPILRNVPDAITISKGTLCNLSDANVVGPSYAGSIGQPFGGIAAADKVVNDGSTTLSCYTEGVFDLAIVGIAQTVGQVVQISGANTCGPALASALLSGAIVGKLEETVTAGGETCRVRLIGY